ncbi:MAG: hypothetical protein WC993_06975 [Methanoculleus sp.]
MTPAKDIIRASILDPPFRDYRDYCPRRGAGEVGGQCIREIPTKRTIWAGTPITLLLEYHHDSPRSGAGCLLRS